MAARCRGEGREGVEAKGSRQVLGMFLLLFFITSFTVLNDILLLAIRMRVEQKMMMNATHHYQHQAAMSQPRLHRKTARDVDDSIYWAVRFFFIFFSHY